MRLVTQSRKQACEGASGASDPLLPLARLAGAGNRNAMRQLVEAVGPAMLRAVRKVMGHRTADVEDVLQEAVEGLLWNFAKRTLAVHASLPLSCDNESMPGTIGLFLRANDNNYQQQLKDQGAREAKRHGFELLVESAENDASKQVAQIRAAIAAASANKLVAVLVSSVRDGELAAIVREAAEAGLAFALLNEGHFVDEIHEQYKDRALFVVTPDQVEIGRTQGRQVRALVGDRGKVLCVTGPMNTEMAQQRLLGLKEILADGFSIIELNADWTSERARMSVEHWLSPVATAELPDMFVAHNDEMALGMRQALRDAASRRDLPLNKALLTGCDGSENFGQRLVREGRMTATVIMPPTSGAAIQWVAKIHSGQDRPPIRVVLPVNSFPATRDLKARSVL